jgi:hypothetical protein
MYLLICNTQRLLSVDGFLKWSWNFLKTLILKQVIFQKKLSYTTKLLPLDNTNYVSLAILNHQGHYLLKV